MRNVFLAAIMLLSVACVPPSRPHSQSDISQREPPPNPALGVFPDKEPKDNFDRTGIVIGDGMRYVWNTSKGAYEWVNTEEHKRQAQEAFDAAKEKASRMLDTAKKSYEEKIKEVEDKPKDK